jgi:predicted RNA-binding Zn-ribbon protein involved in translation (DUF1610 family)
MTSDHDVEQVVEQSVERHFLFHCSCGAAIETSAKREVCPACGETVEVVRCVPRPNGNKYTLRISKHRTGVNAKPPLWPAVLRPTTRTHSAQHQHEVPDREQRFVHLGLLFLLLAAFSIVAFFVPVTYQEGIALLNTPKPRDCDWFSTPLGDKHCHYESNFRYLRDEKGERVVVMWQRVND